MADLVAGAFLSSSFQVLFERLASLLELNFFQSRTLHDEDGNRLLKKLKLNFFQSRTHYDEDGDRLLKKLKLTLLGLNVVLIDAEKQQFTNQSVKDWMDELKDAVYHADDLLDEIATKALGFKVEAEYRRSDSNNQVRASISTSTSTCSLFDAELVSKMEEIIDRLEYFAKQKDVLGLKEVVGQKWSHSHRLPSTCSVDESTVYGRDNDKEELCKLLLSDSGNKIDVITIVGMGGLGKTTLAQLVYNDGRVVEHFDKKAWVCVSDEFDVFRVTKTILVAITLSNNYDTQDLNLLQVKLKEILMGKKFLIVLDDVWNENSSYWEILWTAFTAGAYGSKIIATTRNHSVASIMQTVPTRHLQHLSDGDCWSLFAKIAFDKGDSKAYPELEKIGKQIVARCKGLPLAAKALAGLLRFKLDVEEWDEILKSDIWDLPMDNINILPALRLSYHYLPSHLKQCFAFCSTFPKDYAFEKKKLVLFWIAQNFVQQPRRNKTLEKMGEEYFHELLSRSFFQQASGNKFRFVMHDLVHDLAQVVHGQFSFRVDDKNLLDISPKARHFSYVRGEYDDFEKLKAINEVKCLRSFLPLKSPYGDHPSYLAKKVLENIYPTQRCLRLLSLPHYHIMDLHDSIGNLIHLRYLDLSGTEIKKLPETICNLYNLQTLLLSNCYLLTALPVEMGKLICLRYLDVSGTNLREMLMQMSRLKGLQQLTAFVVGNGSGSGINELKEFHHLHGTLTISSLQNVKSGRDALEAKLKEKKQLEELVLEWGSASDNSQTEREVLDNLQPHTNLKRHSIKQYGGTRFPAWLGDHSYSDIVFLCLDKCDYCISLPPLGQLTSLKHLNIARMNEITTVGKEFYVDRSLTKPFQSLETLRFEEMLEWKEWHIFGVEVFSQLQELSVIKCPKLVGSLPNMPSWVKLEIRDCSALMASLPRTSIADNLVLMGCDGVKLGWQVVSSLVKLVISDMASLKELTPELYTLTNLQEFFIRNCPSLLSFPQTGLPPKLTHLAVGSCEALHSVTVSLNTCLQKLIISNCSSLALDGLPPSLKEIYISSSPKIVFPLSEEMERCYTSLERLKVKGSDCLVSLPLGLFPKLRHISISHCQNFERLLIPNGCGLENLTSLEYIHISGCNSMVSCVQEALHAPNLKIFEVWNCRKLKSLPEGMHSHFPSLESLWIWDCPEIESFPEGSLPSNLRQLSIRGCEKLVACRREWGLQRLPSLTCFEFGGGGKYKEDEDVVESILEEGVLPSTLTWLWIRNLQNLKSLNYKGFQLLSSLETLEVSNCPQLQSLPEEGLLTSLSRLQISRCPLLEARCQSDRGAEWNKIAHIPLIIINRDKVIFEQESINLTLS